MRENPINLIETAARHDAELLAVGLPNEFETGYRAGRLMARCEALVAIWNTLGDPERRYSLDDPYKLRDAFEAAALDELESSRNCDGDADVRIVFHDNGPRPFWTVVCEEFPIGDFESLSEANRIARSHRLSRSEA